MLLLIRTTYRPATDLGYLLRKHPDRMIELDLPSGVARHFFPEATEAGCTAALWVEVDPVGLVRGRDDDFVLRPYVNDRPYAASSMLSVAINHVYRSAMAGSCPERPALAATPLPLTATLPAVSCHGGRRLIERLFAPLGYTVEADPARPDSPAEGPDSAHGPRVWSVRLSHTTPLSLLLRHLYVLIPVMDDEKHYWVGEQEGEKLLQKGEGWLPAHPERDLIARRFLSHQRKLYRPTLERMEASTEAGTEAGPPEAPDPERDLEAPLRLDDLRREAVTKLLIEAGAWSVADLGCGEGKLLHRLAQDRRFTRLLGVDPSLRALERAEARLRLKEQIPGPDGQPRVRLIQGTATGRDARLADVDAICCVEVIEHLDLHAVPAFTAALLGAHRPPLAIVTTPNVEYNATFADRPGGTGMRHPDHRFEWSRAEFRAWAEAAAARYGYTVDYAEAGAPDPHLGPPTQIARFLRAA